MLPLGPTAPNPGVRIRASLERSHGCRLSTNVKAQLSSARLPHQYVGLRCRNVIYWSREGIQDSAEQ
jgi:hypothetical protein